MREGVASLSSGSKRPRRLTDMFTVLNVAPLHARMLRAAAARFQGRFKAASRQLYQGSFKAVPIMQADSAAIGTRC